MKYTTRILLLACALFGEASHARIGPLFLLAEVGESAAANITLCLNGKGPFSCQTFNVTNLTFSVRTVTTQHTYPAAGIKVNTPGYVLSSPQVPCTPASNGYCLFSVSDTSPHVFTLRQSHSLSAFARTLYSVKQSPYRL